MTAAVATAETANGSGAISVPSKIHVGRKVDIGSEGQRRQ